MALANAKMGNSILCYVSKIDVKNNFVEVCDTKYSIKCAFETGQAKMSLKDFI